MVFERLVNPFVLIPVLASAAYVLYTKATQVVLPDLPWVGGHWSFFSKSKFTIRRSKDNESFYKAVYENYSKKGQSFIYPHVLGPAEIILPNSYTQWIFSQPENILSSREHHRDSLQTDYTFGDPIVCQNSIHTQVVREDLTRALKTVTEPVMDELKNYFDECLGFDDWQEVGVWNSVLKAFARSSNRIFVGLSLCRNEEFLKNAIHYAEDIPLSAMVLNVIPDFARPFLAWFVTIPNRKHYNAAAKFLKPIVEQRMVDIANARQDPDSKYQEPDDFISWSIHAAENAPDPKERTVVMLSRRFMTMNFVAIHTTAVTSANALLDIFSTRPEQRVVETLREEAARVYNEEGQRWTKNGLARMHHMDSAIRESMRMHNFIIWGAQRKVMAKGGVIAPNGLHLPEGSSISVQAFAAHRSPEMYKNPDVFDPFRFSRLRETEEKESQSAHIKGITAATTSDHFMHFGHGRYACPGRFFAIQEVKLLLAYLIINYEVKLYATRPPNSWLGDIILPPAKATMMVRRKATPLAV